MGKNQSSSNLTNIIQYNNGNIAFVSGSTTLMQISSSGAITTTGVISGSNALSASYAATASFVNTAQTASFVTTAQTASFVTTAQTASFVTTAQTASFVTLAQTASFVANAQSASNAVTAQTASFANAFTVAGTLTAQTLVVQTITSSVDYVTGSTRFGSLSSNTHVFTGSLAITGGLAVNAGTTTLTGNLNLQGAVTRNINFYDSSNTNINAQIQYDQISSNSGQLFFGTNNAGTFATRLTISNTGAATFSSTVDGTIFNSTSNAFRFSGNNAISLVSLNAQNVVKINAAGYWGTQLVGANDQGILIDNAGKVGVGVNVLSGWDTTLKPIEIGCSGSFYAGFNGLPLIYMGANAYYNGGWKYASSNTSYRPLLADMGNGNFHFLNAQTGSAGSTISWTTLMKLDNSGNVGIGVSSPQSKVDIQNGNIGIYNNTASSNGAQLYLGDMNFPGGVYYNSAPGLGAAYNSSQGVAGDLAFYIYASSAGSRNEAMRIKGGNGGVSVTGAFVSMDGAGPASFSSPPSGLGYGLFPYSGVGLGVSSVANGIGFWIGGTERLRIAAASTNPVSDNAYTLGASGIRWSAVWAANGTIQTSDEREKKDITDTDLGLDFINKLRPVSYKWKVGQNIVTSEPDGVDEKGEEKFKTIITPIEGKRTHYGLIAQEVEALLDGKDFGGFIHDKETDIMGLRYDQFVPLLIKSIQELKAENDTLKEILQRNNIQ
jgi:hypothetical protein